MSPITPRDLHDEHLTILDKLRILKEMVDVVSRRQDEITSNQAIITDNQSVMNDKLDEILAFIKEVRRI